MVRSRTTRGEAGDFRMTKRRKYPLEAMADIEKMYAEDVNRDEIVAMLAEKHGVTITAGNLTNLANRQGFKRSADFIFGPKTPVATDARTLDLYWERRANSTRPPDNPRAANVVRHPVPPGGYRMGRSP